MLNIARAVHSPRALRALTGVSRAEFEQLEGRLTVGNCSVLSDQFCSVVVGGKLTILDNFSFVTSAPLYGARQYAALTTWSL
jgi:hypothetical protein